MRPKRSVRKPTRQRTATIRRDAAGIDIGARRIHVAVDPECDARPVREFQTFTQDLYALADWLEACGVPLLSGHGDLKSVQTIDTTGDPRRLVTGRYLSRTRRFWRKQAAWSAGPQTDGCSLAASSLLS